MVLDDIEMKQRADFNDFVLKWTGRDLAYHARYGTTGLDFAWECWREATRIALENSYHDEQRP